MARTKAFNKDQALEKALDVFWCNGYEATSMQDLVDAMGINRQSLYDTFHDKHTLYLAALDHYDQKQVTYIRSLLEQPGSARDALRRVFSNLIEEATSQNRQGCFYVNSAVELAGHDAETARRVTANQAQMEGMLQKVIVHGQAQGEIRSRHRPDRLARFLFNNLLGLRVMMKATQDPDALRDVVETVLAALD